MFPNTPLMALAAVALCLCGPSSAGVVAAQAKVEKAPKVCSQKGLKRVTLPASGAGAALSRPVEMTLPVSR